MNVWQIFHFSIPDNMKLVLIAIFMVQLKSTQACRPPPSPPPPQPPRTTKPVTSAPIPATEPPTYICPDILPDTAAGMAPLYGIASSGTNTYLIVLNDGTTCAKIMNKMKRISTTRRISSMHGKESRLGVNFVTCVLDSQQLYEVRKMQGVRYVEKEAVVTNLASTNVWSLDRIDQRNLPLQYDYSPSGSGQGTHVYVIDSGVNANHVLFEGRAENWHAEVSVSYNDDCTGHGTHVAGTVGAKDYGVATEAIIRSVRVFGCGSSTSIEIVVAAMNRILDFAEGGGVVSMSLSGPKSAIIDESVNKLIDAGFVVVVAAGNDGSDACARSPARVPRAITVGAVDINDQIAHFSNNGQAVNIFAPGVNVESLLHTSNTGTTTNSGTSMSTPHVSGVAAILLAQGIEPEKVRQNIYASSTKGVVKNRPPPVEHGLNGARNRLLYVEPVKKG